MFVKSLDVFLSSKSSVFLYLSAKLLNKIDIFTTSSRTSERLGLREVQLATVILFSSVLSFCCVFYYEGFFCFSVELGCGASW